MNNISIIELQEEQLDNINAASARSFFKKVGKTMAKIGLTMAEDTVQTVGFVGDLIDKGGKAIAKKCS